MKESTKFKEQHKADFGREKIELLYEDKDIAIIYKPEGMLSVPYPGSHSRTAIAVLENIMRKAGTYSANHRPFTVHRLDRETSGVMMFALNEHAQKIIMNTWHKMVTERLYRAVAENPEHEKELPQSGIIEDELAYNAYNVGFVPKQTDLPNKNAKKELIASKNKNNEKSIYQRNLTIKNGKAEFKTISARTHYKIIERGKTHTLFELSLDTGRKNQIRAHLASKGYPLAGDENYRAKTDPFGRLALHARTLEFIHPFTGKKMKFEVPEPENWIDCVKKQAGSNEKPIWQANSKTLNKNNIYSEIKKQRDNHISSKKLNKMDFISKGKVYKH